jgi:hypothetical protein
MHLLTFPRSGSVIFILLTNIKIIRTHSVASLSGVATPIIGIVKDPIESLASYLSMLDYLNPDRNNDARIRFLDQKKWINLYKEVYSYYLQDNCFLILNSDLQENPEKTIDALFKNFNMAGVFNKTGGKIPKVNYLPTSKITKEYPKRLEELKKINLKNLYTLYNKAREKAIRVQHN